MSTPQQDIELTYRAAFDYQSLIRLVAVQTVSATLLRAFRQQLFDSDSAPPVILAVLVAASTGMAGFFGVKKVVALAKYLQVSRPNWWALATAIPVLSVIVLVILSRRMQRRLQACGISVGILGPSNESVYACAERASQALKRTQHEESS